MKYADVDEMYLPSQSQKELWWYWIKPRSKPNADGWWKGYCPLHDKDRRSKKASASFQFDHGVMQCHGITSCHEGKRVMSLTNVMIKMNRSADG